MPWQQGCAFLPTRVPCAESDYKTLSLQDLGQGLVTCLPTEARPFYGEARPRNNPKRLPNINACDMLSSTFCKDASCLQPILLQASRCTVAV